MANHYPAEVFGFPVTNRSVEAQAIRERFWCPFADGVCNKKSRLIDYPMGVCSVQVGENTVATCPRRFLQAHTVFRDIALDYFGSTGDLLLFREVGLKGVGSFDYVLVHHKPMSSEIDGFVVVEFQTDQTTSTGKLIDALNDFQSGKDVTGKNYGFGMNTYDTLKRSYTQILNKGVVMEQWEQRIYWVFQSPVFDNLSRRYQPKFSDGSDRTNVFAVYDLLPGTNIYTLTLQRFISASVNAMFQALRENPNIPGKDQFVKRLKAYIDKKKPSHRIASYVIVALEP